MFECKIDEEYIPVSGIVPDSTQKEVLWFDLIVLSKVRFYPKEMISYLQNYNISKLTIYLGDIN